jgi:hypothetical protein
MTVPLLAITFLAPIAGLVAAAIAVPLLLAIYFLKLRRMPTRISSTLLWEAAARDLQANVPFRMLRPSWLLALQLLILALLLLAIARPALELPGLGAQRVIIVIDRSASMSARDGHLDSELPASARPITRLERAKQLARETATRATRAGGQAMVVAFASRPQPLTQFTRNRSLLHQTIDAIEPTDQPADFDRLLAQLAALSQGSADESADAEPPPHVVLISDGQLRRVSLTGPTLPAERLTFLRAGPAEQTPKDNFGIVGLAARRYIDDPSLVRVFVRVRSTSAAPQTLTLTASLDGVVIDTASLAIPGATTDPATGATTLGEAGHSFQLRATDAGLLVVSHARPDALPSDDAAAVGLQPPDRPRLALVQPAGARTIGDIALMEALATIEPARFDLMTADEYAQRRRATGFFQSYDLLVFNRVTPEALPPVASLTFNAGLPIAGVELAEPLRAGTLGFAFWDRGHPILRGVGLGVVLMDQPAHLTLPPPPGSGSSSPDADGASSPSPRADAGLQTSVLASTTNGPAIVLCEHSGVRRLIVAPDLDSTTWWSDQSFPIFLANAVEHLTLGGAHQVGLAFQTATEARLALPPTTAPIQLLPPDGRAPLAVPAGPGGLTSLGVLPTAGVWTARVGEQSIAVPVNLLDADESSLATADALTVAGATVQAGTHGSGANQEIWRWLVAVAAALLALEWMVFVARSRI